MSKLSDAFAQSKFDGWQNDLTGFGTSRDKTTYGRFVAGRLLEDWYIADLYHDSDLAARAVNVRPDESFREGFTVSTGDTDVDEYIAEKMEDLGAREALADGMRWGRAFGGGAVLIGADDKRPSDVELIPERCDDIHWLYAFDRRFIQPLTYVKDQRSADFGKPETYIISSANGRVSGASKIVHASRLIIFGGSNTAEQERQENGGWDLSILQRIHAVLRQFDTGWTSVENLLTDANQGVWKVSGLADALTAGRENYVQQRIQQADMRRSNVRSMIIDAGDQAGGSPPEEFQRQSVSFEGIPNTLDKLMLRLAAACETPVTILMGQSPAGMSATGESDFRWFYDSIRAEQTQKLGPLIRKRLVQTWMRTKAGQKARAGNDLKVQIKWPPLWTETPSEVATRRKTLFEGDAIAIQAGVFLPDEIALLRGSQDGLDKELVLDDDARAAREAAVKLELDSLKSGTNETEDTPPSGPPGFGPTGAAPSGAPPSSSDSPAPAGLGEDG